VWLVVGLGLGSPESALEQQEDQVAVMANKTGECVHKQVVWPLVPLIQLRFKMK
jgi:hypothetical protein